ncbi:MAG: M23 family metallopeptidase, partial [Spirochaetota bacterium]
MWNRQIPMNKADRVIFFCCLLILSVMCTSFRWPLSTVKLTSTFGESRGDHLHDGVDIVSYDTRVYPVADSAVLYAWNSSYFPFENFTGSGNYLILDHGETASIYLHLEDSLALSPNYTTNQSVGHFANTGRSYGAHIHFGLYDRISWDSINFFSVIEAPQDDTPPVVDHMAFYIDGTYTRISNNASIRLTQHYPLLLNVYDTISKGDRFGIYKMTV